MQPPHENSYFIDVENATETARLVDQDRILTRSIGGLFPDDIDPSPFQYVLDVACGPGGWVIDTAFTYPQCEVVGIDISQTTLQYARALAQVQHIHNAVFQEMDALQPLDFPDNAFDFVNSRLLIGFMPRNVWPHFFQECLRILRPGGFIRLTETGQGLSNGPASEKLGQLITPAMYRAGLGFSPERGLGVDPELRDLLSHAGFQNVQSKITTLDFSAGREAHSVYTANLLLAFELMQPFLIKLGAATQEELDELLQQTRSEMSSDDFYGTIDFLSLWGQKPA